VACPGTERADQRSGLLSSPYQRFRQSFVGLHGPTCRNFATQPPTNLSYCRKSATGSLVLVLLRTRLRRYEPCSFRPRHPSRDGFREVSEFLEVYG
jgi:hypothetical protein